MRSAAVLFWVAIVLSSLAPPLGASECHGREGAGADLEAEDAAFSAHASRRDNCADSAGNSGGHSAHYPFTIREVVDAPLTFDGCPPGEMYAAIEYRQIRFAGDEGAVLYNDFDCVPYSGLDPAPVVPPSNGDVWDVVREQLPLPMVRLSPGAKGLVGIETWFWADPAADGLQQIDHDGDPSTPPRWGLTITAQVEDVATTATVWIDEYRWRADDDVLLAAPRPGSEPDPAAVHTYARKGTRDLVASTVWRGTWTSPLGGGDLGPAELTGVPLAYRVHEVRSVPADH